MNKSNPLVSVIIPTHNRKTLLKKAVQSVLDQTYKNFEIIIVDNGSTDGTDQFINNWNHSQIRYHWQEDSGGPASPRNKGIKLSKGEYIAFLDSDDLWLPEKLERQISFFQQNKEYGMAFSNSYYFENPEEPKGKLLSEKFVFDSSRQTEILMGWNVIPQLTVMVRKKSLLDAGDFDEDPEIKIAEDYDMWLRLSLNHKIGYIPEILSMHRYNGENLSAGQNFCEKQFKVIEKFVIFNKDILSNSIRDASQKALKKHTILSFEYYWQNGLPGRALETLNQICAKEDISNAKHFFLKKLVPVKIFYENKAFRFFTRRIMRYLLGYNKRVF